MLQGLTDWLAQYRAMLSKSEKRRRHAESAALLDRLETDLGAGDLVVDCGANVGAIAARLARGGATIHCFEPDPVAFSELQGRLGENPRAHLHQAAAGARAGSVTLYRDRSFHKDPVKRTTRSTIIEGGRRMGSEGEGVSVPVVDLPEFLAGLIAEQGRITLLKMDIEGAEVDVLEAMAERALFDHIGLTVVETHEKKFAHLRPRYRRLRRTLAARWPREKVNLDWH